MYKLPYLRSVCVICLISITLQAQSAISAVPSCGEPINSYRGIVAKSNGQFHASPESCNEYGIYGLRYQCVEYVKRFYSEAYEIDTTNWTGDAYQYFDNASKLGFDYYTNRVSQTPPLPDDLLVYKQKSCREPYECFGHVAIVTNTSPSSINIIEQNWSQTGIANLNYSYSNDAYKIHDRGSFSVLGWLRLKYTNTESQLTVVASGLSGLNRLAIDQTNMYWTESSGIVKKLNLSNDTLTPLVTSISSGGAGIVVDNSYIYWAATSGGGSGNIYKTSVLGGSVTPLAYANQPWDIAVDSEYVYWAEANGGPYGTNAIRKVHIDGGPMITIASNGTLHGVMAIDSNNVYFRYMRSNTWRIGKVSKNGGAIIDLATNLTSHPVAIAVDAGEVFWIEENTGVLNKVSIDGGVVTPLAIGLQKPQRLAIDANNIYWTELGNIVGTGTIKRMSRAEGITNIIKSGLFNPTAITMGNIYIYWAEQGINSTDGSISKIYKSVSPEDSN